jgi:hypothetical protein
MTRNEVAKCSVADPDPNPDQDPPDPHVDFLFLKNDVND